jgi:DeoR/GlpR family transcriptional regulator of sugar metabolism
MNPRITLSEEARSAITKTITTNPELSYQRIAERYSVSLWTIYSIAKEAGIRRSRGTAAKAYRKEAS